MLMLRKGFRGAEAGKRVCRLWHSSKPELVRLWSRAVVEES